MGDDSEIQLLHTYSRAGAFPRLTETEVLENDLQKC